MNGNIIECTKFLCNIYFSILSHKNTCYRILVVVIDIKTFSTLLISCLTLKFSEKRKVKFLTLAKKWIVENVDKGMLFYEYYVWLIFVTFDRFVCFCLFVVLCPTGEFFTYMETSPLLAKSWKCWPILDTHGHSAVRIR